MFVFSVKAFRQKTNHPGDKSSLYQVVLLSLKAVLMATFKAT